MTAAAVLVLAGRANFLQLHLRQKFGDLCLRQLLCSAQPRAECTQLLAASELLAEACHELETSRIEVARSIELLEGLQRGLVLPAAHLHFRERDQRSRAFLRRNFLGAGQPFVAPCHCVLQVGGAGCNDVIGGRGVSLGCGARQQLLRAAPAPGRQVEQATLRVVARPAASAFGA